MVAYSFKRQFVAPICKGLGRDIPNGFEFDDPDFKPLKRQTIRAIGAKRHARAGEMVQLYHAQRTKQCIRIGVARCVAAKAITIFFARSRDWTPRYHPWVKIAGEPRYGSEGRNACDMFSHNDGFSSWDEMDSFWRAEHPDIERFEGVLIQWEPIT